MQRILILGAGFAGLWSAIGAARRRDELGIDPARLEILVIDQNPWHSIRVRNYESELEQTRVPLTEVLDPVGVKHLAGLVSDIDVMKREVAYEAGDQTRQLTYDRLVTALGSRLVRPAIPGLETYGFDVDTYEAGCRLNQHVADLPKGPSGAGQYTTLVVGGGLTGIEAATELVSKLKQARESAPVAARDSAGARGVGRSQCVDRLRHGRQRPAADCGGVAGIGRRNPCRSVADRGGIRCCCCGWRAHPDPDGCLVRRNEGQSAD